ncbi:MAG: TPR end-of-group domain-containing protein [Pyrinomonadaceae bacterium]
MRPNVPNLITRGALLVTCWAVCAVMPGRPAHATPQAPAAAPTPPPTAVRPSTPTEVLPRGRVVETVATLKDPAQTYALYLPSSYTPARRWPTLYCFDPAARGRLPVKLYSEAAERFGWVVVGSNDSRNGPLKASLDAAGAMIDDVQARLSVDGRRIYTAGFSGGARQAILLDQLCRHCLAGVIASGAGYPPNFKPEAPVTFALFGAAGVDDFNYAEMKTLDATLARLGAVHRFESFEGGHAWLTPALAATAVEWMELQALKAGLRPKDEAFAAGVWERRLSEARRLEAESKPYAAYGVYESLGADFRGLRDTAEAEGRAAALGASKEVKAALRDEAEQLSRQQQLVARLFELAERRRGEFEEKAQAASDFRALVEGLRVKSKAEADSGERRVARRTLNQVSAHFYEAAATLRQQRARPPEVVAALEVASEVASQSPQLFYELAVAHALNSDKKRSLAALRKAFELGFKDAAALEQEPALEVLRGEAEYKRLVEGARAGP